MENLTRSKKNIKKKAEMIHNPIWCQYWLFRKHVQQNITVFAGGEKKVSMTS